MKAIRTWLARRRLARMVAANKASFAVQDYARRREAMLKHTRRAHA